ncbi:hypothetical protein Patl1_15740 [Pistacia atlantica]|uniref:Uncharacterized protein n=1 Tax=Pistacia atlantica TaxID=434234 RepID=A0ACC1BAT7_9ROSI|nr:hypothetical protein Patl1_15740 [Pistacia atlantica]
MMEVRGLVAKLSWLLPPLFQLPNFVHFSADQMSISDTSSAVERAGPGSSASTRSQSSYNSSSSTVAAYSSSKVGPTSWMHTVSSFTFPPGLSGAPGTPGPLGLVPSPLMNALSAIMDSNSSAVWRPSVSTAPAPSNQRIQHPMCHARPPFSSYPAVYPIPFLLPTLGMPHLSVASNDSLPPGASSVANVGATPTSSAASRQQVVGASGMQTEPPSGIGESTYNKPAGFKGEADKVSVQPTLVSMDYLVGSDWALVKTNDGKKYYYNSKTKV